MDGASADGGGGAVAVVVNRTSSYILGIVRAVRDELAARGTPMLVHIHDQFTADVSPSLRHAVERGDVRGVVVLPTSEPQPRLKQLLAEHPEVPAVAVGDPLGGRAAVMGDNRPGATALAEHLLSRPGVRRVALVRGAPHNVDSLEREEVFRAALAARGLPLPDELVVDGMFERETAYRGVARLLREGRRFDAVAALNDASAAGAVDALLDAGLRVPGDVLVSGFDDDRVLHSRCPLTTVSQDLARQGVLAVELLDRLLAGEEVERVVRVPTRLLVRRSTTRDPAGAEAVGAEADGAEADGAEAARASGDVAVLHTVLTLNRALMTCTSEREAMRELRACLPRLGVQRAFVVLHEPPDPAGGPQRGRVHLAHPARPGADPGPFPVRELLPPALRPELRSGCLVVQPLSVPGGEIGYVLYDEPELREHTAEVLRIDLSTRLDTLARQHELEAAVARRTEELRLVNAELRRSLHLDGLTGIANRTAFDEHLHRAWEGARAAGAPLSLLFVDVDHFKAYNDTYGHLRGDEALREVARALAAACRGEDLAARFGGEEFALLLPGTDAAGAAVVAERVRELVRLRCVEHRASPVRPWLTVSVGIATAHPASAVRAAAPGSPGASAGGLVAAADAAVYVAKAAGRDRSATA